MNQKPVKVQSVMRALQLLEILMRSNTPLSAAEISRQTSLNRSTVYSLLDTLIACDYVRREVSYGKYCPTIKMYAMSKGYADRLPFVRICVPIVTKFAIKYNFALNLGLLTQDNALCIIKEFLPADYQYRSSGFELPFHASSLGKIHLAFLPDEQSGKILAEHELVPFTQYTIRSKDELCNELERIRRRGYAVVHDEYAYGYSSIGFPVFGGNRHLVGAFSFTMTSDKISDLPPNVLNEGLQASRDCSVEMGCSNPPVFLPDE